MKVLLVLVFLVVAVTARRQWLTTTPTKEGWLASLNPSWHLHNGYQHLITQPDGNLCVRYGNGNIVEKDLASWCSRDIARPGFFFVTVLLNNGNLCTFPGLNITNYEARPIWCSSWTTTHWGGLATGNYFLILQDDGNLCTYRGTGPNDKQGTVWCSMVLSQDLSKFSMVITSDPQIARAADTNADPDPRFIPRPWRDQESTNEKGSALWNYSFSKVGWQYYSIKLLARSGAVPTVRGVMVNGDITEWGHAEQLDVSNQRLNELGENFKWWPGLGNHDLADCASDLCRGRMLRWMYEKIEGFRSRKMLTRSDANKGTSGLFNVKTVYSGTFGYSFDDGPLHVIQLQHHPEYSADFFEHQGFGDRFTITPIIGWLAADLAANKDKIIIINMHGENGNYTGTRFENVVYQYRSSIAAIFTGHLHHQCGFRYYTGTVPTFRSGAASYGDYLNAEFDFPSLTMTVRRVLNDNCGAFKLSDSRTICKMGDAKIAGSNACTVYTDATNIASQNSDREPLHLDHQGCFDRNWYK